MEQNAERPLPHQVPLQGSIEAQSELPHTLASIGIFIASSRKQIIVSGRSSTGLRPVEAGRVGAVCSLPFTFA